MNGVPGVYSHAAFIDRDLNKDVPFVVDASVILTDRTFRDYWVWDKDVGIKIIPPSGFLSDTSATTTLKTFGTDEVETFTGSSRIDVVYAGGGDDTVYTVGGDDRVYAGSGDDTIVGVSGEGNDYYSGGS